MEVFRHNDCLDVVGRPSAAPPPPAIKYLLPDRLMVGQRFLVPSIEVRVLVGQQTPFPLFQAVFQNGCLGR